MKSTVFQFSGVLAKLKEGFESTNNPCRSRMKACINFLEEAKKAKPDIKERAYEYLKYKSFDILTLTLSTIDYFKANPQNFTPGSQKHKPDSKYNQEIESIIMMLKRSLSNLKEVDIKYMPQDKLFEIIANFMKTNMCMRLRSDGFSLLVNVIRLCNKICLQIEPVLSLLIIGYIKPF